MNKKREQEIDANLAERGEIDAACCMALLIIEDIRTITILTHGPRDDLLTVAEYKSRQDEIFAAFTNLHLDLTRLQGYICLPKVHGILCAANDYPAKFMGKVSESYVLAIYDFVKSLLPKAEKLTQFTIETISSVTRGERQEAMAQVRKEFQRAMKVDPKALHESPISPISQRDTFIYRQDCACVPYKQIMADIRKTPEWDPIETINGIKAASKRYADANSLPTAPKRQKRGSKNGKATN